MRSRITFKQKSFRALITALTMLVLVIVTLNAYSQTATVGDYRSKASGTWATAGTWEKRTAANTWSTATTAPTAANNVYIQAGHTVTIGAAGAVCNDLHFNATGVLALSTYTLSVSGKLRNYSGTVVTGTTDGTFYSGQSNSTSPANNTIITGTGKISFVGSTRTITTTGEWGIGSGTSSGWTLDFSLTAANTGTLQTAIQAGVVTVTSGIVDMGTNGLFINQSAYASCNVTISNGATLKSSATGSGASAVMSKTTGSAAGKLTVSAGGTLLLLGLSPTIAFSASTPYDFSGVVEYGAAGAQTFLAVTNGGTSAPGSSTYPYSTVRLSGSGQKKLNLNTTINTSLIMAGTATFYYNLNTLTYGPSASLEYASTVTIPTPASTNEWTSSSALPASLVINAAVTVPTWLTLVVNGGLTLQSGSTLTIGNNSTFTVKGDAVNNGGTLSMGATSTEFKYSKGSANQAVMAATYTSLTFDNYAKILPSSGSIIVTGTFTPGTGTGHTITGSTFEFNSTSSQTIPAFTYYNLTTSGARSYSTITFGTGTVGIANTLTLSATFSSGYYYAMNSSNVIDYNGTGSQAVVAIPTGSSAYDYNSLTISGNRGGSGVITFPSSIIGIANTFSLTATNVSSWVMTGNTIKFNGGMNQLVPTLTGFSYNNLTIANSYYYSTLTGTPTTITGDLTVGSSCNLKWGTGSARTVNITNSGASSVGLAGSGTLDMSGMAHILTLSSQSPTFSGTLTPGTAVSVFEYNRSGAQTILGLGYYYLKLSGTGVKTASSYSTVSIATNGTMEMAGTTTPPTFALGSGASVQPNISGTTLKYTATSAQTTGAEWSTSTSFATVEIANAAGVTMATSFSPTMDGNTLKLTSGALTVGANTITFSTGNTPISRTSGTLTTTVSSSLVFGTTYYTGGNAFALPNGTFTSSPAMLSNFSIYRDNVLTFGDQDITVASTLTMNKGVIDLNTRTLTLGNNATATLTYSGSYNPVLANGTFKRWFMQTAYPSGLATSKQTYPEFPMGTAAGDLRSFWVWKASGGTVTAGYIAITHTDAGGITAIGPFTDAGVNVTVRSNRVWGLTIPSTNPYGCTVNLSVRLRQSSNTFTVPSGGTVSDLRIVSTSTAAPGTHGTTGGSTSDPEVTRTAIPTPSSGTTLNLYIGTSGASMTSIIHSNAAGNWSTPATWVGNSVPGSADDVFIDHAVIIDGTTTGTPACNNLTISNGSGTTHKLTMSANTLNIGPSCGGNRKFDILGALDLSGTGVINVNGYVNVVGSGYNANFKMTGGSINIDGNDGTTAGSVDETVSLFSMGSSVTIAVSGGTITFIDPHFATPSTNGTYNYGYGTAFEFSTGSASSWTGNTMVFGGASCTNASTATYGFVVDCGSSGYLTLGNVTVNGGTGASRATTVSNYMTSHPMIIGGALTINANSTLATIGGSYSGSDLYAGGNLTNNGTLTIAASTELGFSKGSSTATSATQTIGGTGTYTLSGDLRINNTNPVITMGTSLTLAGALTMTNGRVVLGSNDFTWNNAGASIGGSTLSATNMFAADGTGQFKRLVSTTGYSYYDFPVGDATGTAEYSPVQLYFSSNAAARTIGVRLVNGDPSNYNTGGIGLSYLHRHFYFTDNSSSAYNYSGYLQYKTADVVSTEADLIPMNWNGSAWASISGASINTTNHQIVFGSGTTALLNGTQMTGRTGPPPSNDACSAATTLTITSDCTSPIAGTTASATNEGGLTSCSSTAKDVWYSFTSPANGTMRIVVNGAAGFDPVLNLRTNATCPGASVICYDFTGNGATEKLNITGLAASTVYKIRVAAGGTAGDFTICTSSAYTPSGNDNVSGAITAIVGSTTGNANNNYGMQLGEPTGYNWYTYGEPPTNSQWFVFTPAATSCYQVASTGFDTQLAIYTAGNVNNFATYSEVASDDDSGPLYSSVISAVTLNAGTTYYIQVNGFPYTNGTPTLTITNLSVAPPVATAATNNGCTGFTANWNTVTNAAGYFLDVSKDNFSTFVTGYNNLNVTNVLTYPVSGLTTGTAYQYRVRAYGQCSGSPLSGNSNIIYDTTFYAPSTPVFTAGATTLCAGQGSTYTATSAYATSISYSIVAGSESIDPVTGVVIAASNNFTVRATATNTCGTVTTDLPVTVNPLPSMSITTNPSPATICAGGSAQLTASGATMYLWSPATGLNDENLYNPTATPANTTVYTVTGTLTGCTAAASVTVTVNPIPNVSINSNPSPATFCTGGSAQLTAGGATSFSWLPATGLDDAGIYNPVASPTSTTVYSVTGTSLGCTAQSTITVTVNPIPVVTVSSNPSPATVCSGLSAQLTAGGANSYSWTPSTGLNNAGIYNPSASPSVTTTYTVTGNSLGCTDTATVTVTILVCGATWTGLVSTDWNTPGNWSGNNVPIQATDVIIPSGTLNQPVISNAAKCNQLSIASGATLTIMPHKSLTAYGNTTLNGAQCLILKSSAVGTASFIDNGTIGGPGTAKIERYITANYWHYISSPVASATAVIFSGQYIKKWLEPTYAWQNITTLSTPLAVMNGYALKSSLTKVYTYVGKPNTGTKTFNLTRNSLPSTGQRGWNLIGNPYPSAIDWDDNLGWTKSNVDGAIYIYNQTYGTYATYNYPFGTNGGINYIAEGQGFYVTCNTNPGLLSVNNHARVHKDSTFFKSAIQADFIRLTIHDGLMNDDMIVRIEPQSTAAFDGDFDAYKIVVPGKSQLWSKGQDNVEYAINTLPDVQNNPTVPVAFMASGTGLFTITASEFEQLNQSTQIYLEDLKTGVVTNLADSRTYEFYAAPGDDENRFMLHFDKPATAGIHQNTEADGLSIYPNPNNGMFNLLSSKATNGSIEVYNVLGERVYSRTATVFTGMQLDLGNLTSGVYYLSLKSNDGIHTLKFVVN